MKVNLALFYTVCSMNLFALSQYDKVSLIFPPGSPRGVTVGPVLNLLIFQVVLIRLLFLTC